MSTEHPGGALLPAGGTPPLTGIVLCGGESRRMGSDKGLLPWPPTAGALADAGAPLTWAGRAAALLQGLDLPWRISVRAAQVDAYARIFGDRLVIDEGEVPGPLGGLLSAHHACPGTDLLLLACDMIAVDEALLRVLVDAYRDTPGEDFFVYQNDGFAEPFPGIYRAGGIAAVQSLQVLLRGGRTAYLPVTRPGAFVNRNTP